MCLRRTRTRILFAILACVSTLAAAPAWANDVEAAVELSNGAHIFFIEDWRETLGWGPSLALGVAVRHAARSPWLTLEVGGVRARGRELDDPTFEFFDATTLWLVPVTVGLRVDLMSRPQIGPPRTSLGGALLIMKSWLDDPIAGSTQDSRIGFAFDVRTQLVRTGTWRLWARPRVLLLDDSQHGFRRLNASGAQIAFGVAWGKYATRVTASEGRVP